MKKKNGWDTLISPTSKKQEEKNNKNDKSPKSGPDPAIVPDPVNGAH